MAIGEFGGAPSAGGPALSNGLYWMYELGHAALQPSRAIADATRLYFKNPLNPWSHTTLGKIVAPPAPSCSSARPGATASRTGTSIPSWSSGERVPIHVTTVWERPFCNLLHFERMFATCRAGRSRKVLIVAPMSGHYATLLRGTVEAFLPDHDVYITDWVDARMVPLSDGRFDLDDYIDYVIGILHCLGGDTPRHRGVPAVGAGAGRGGADGGRANDPYAPRSMTLMGGPIDTRVNPTAVNELAEARGVDWFRRNVITKVPFPHPGVMRDVYPGFLQLNGFVSMNLDRHLDAHQQSVPAPGARATAIRRRSIASSTTNISRSWT